MTPEERAKIIDASFGRREYGNRLQLAIVDAIRLAIEDERERVVRAIWINEQFVAATLEYLSVTLNQTPKKPD